MNLLYRPQFSDEWLPASVSGDAANILISALLRLDYEVLAWDGEDWVDACEMEDFDA